MTATLPRPTRLPRWRYLIRQTVAAVILVGVLLGAAAACTNITGIDLCDDPTCNRLLPLTQ